MAFRIIALVLFVGSCCTLAVSQSAHSHHEHLMHLSSINHTSDATSTDETARTTVEVKHDSHVTDQIPSHEDHKEFLKFVNQTETDHEHHMHHHESMEHGMLNDQGQVVTKNELSKIDQSHKEHLIRKEEVMDHSMNHEGHDMDHAGHDKGHDGHDNGHDGHGNGHGGHDMDMDMKNGSGMHGMKMWFHTGEDETILFQEWRVTTAWGMVGSMIGIVLLGMFYEGLKYFREYLFKQYISSMQFATVAVTGESGRVTQVHKVEKHRMLSLAHGIQTCLHIVQIVMSYFLMLIFMTYNVWLCLAVVVGSGLGYFIFGWKKATVVDITEHCH